MSRDFISDINISTLNKSTFNNNFLNIGVCNNTHAEN